jgi:hypothetical protein
LQSINTIPPRRDSGKEKMRKYDLNLKESFLRQFNENFRTIKILRSLRNYNVLEMC